MIGGIVSDNWGRRSMLLLCLTSALVGFAMLLMAPGIGTISLAMMIIGMGCDVSINVAVMLLSEVMDN